jgi:hypothetical protein
MRPRRDAGRWRINHVRIAIVIGISLAVVTGASASAVAPTHSSGAKARLILMDNAPLTLRGTQFDAGERVRLIVVAGRRVTKQLRANGAGGFVVRFRGTSLGRCAGYTAIAVGARGSRASIGAPNAYCPPPH